MGEKVLVQYLSSRPSDGQIDSFGAKWELILGFGIASGVLPPLGVILLHRLRSQGFSLDPITFGLEKPVAWSTQRLRPSRGKYRGPSTTRCAQDDGPSEVRFGHFPAQMVGVESMSCSSLLLMILSSATEG